MAAELDRVGDVSTNGRGSARSPVTGIVRDAVGTTIFLQGDLDLHTAALVGAVVEEESDRRPARLVLDLTAVEFIDSSALSLFVTAHRDLRDRSSTLVLASPPPAVWRVFVKTSLDRALVFDGAPPA
jgi:anti-anti-sigma factor